MATIIIAFLALQVAQGDADENHDEDDNFDTNDSAVNYHHNTPGVASGTRRRC